MEMNEKKTSSLRYAIGMFGTSIPINMFKTYAATFYIDRLSLVTTGQFALILLIYTFVDAIDNPIYGFLSDRTRTRWGRRRVWLMCGAPLLVMCFILFFNPPASLGPESAFGYVVLMYMLTGTLDSLINANYGALFPELFPTEEQRAKTNAMRQVFQFLAMVISIALTPVITDALGFAKTAYIYGALSIAVIWFLALGVHESEIPDDQKKPELLKSLWQLVTNPKFWLYGITNAAFFAGLALVQSGVPFYVKYHLVLGGMGSTILLGVSILCAILFIPVWVWIIKRVHLMRAWRISLAVASASVLLLSLTPSLATSILVVVSFGFALGGVSTTMDIVAARILDEDRQRYNIRREGTYMSLLSILNKASGLFSAAAYYLVSALYGFKSGDNPGTNPNGASVFLTALFPGVVLAIAFGVSRFLRFGEVEK